MRWTKHIVGRIIVAAAAALLLSQASQAQEWPNRTVTILVPNAAGGNTDLMARMAADWLTKSLGKSFIVENRVSTGGILTSTQTANSTPDGHTLHFASNATVLLTPLVQKVNINLEDVLVPVTNVGTGAQVIAIKRSLPATNLQEFIAYAKANPGKLNFAAAGINNLSHLAPIFLFKRTDADVVMLPLRGEADAINSVISRDADFYYGNASILLQYKDHEALRLIAVGTSKRIQAAPDIPTVAESFPGFEFSSWNGFFVPKGTPDAIITRLRSEIAKMTAVPEIRARLNALGITPGGESAEEVKASFDRDRASYIGAVASAGVKPQ